MTLPQTCDSALFWYKSKLACKNVRKHTVPADFPATDLRADVSRHTRYLCSACNTAFFRKNLFKPCESALLLHVAALDTVMSAAGCGAHERLNQVCSAFLSSRLVCFTVFQTLLLYTIVVASALRKHTFALSHPSFRTCVLMLRLLVVIEDAEISLSS